MKSPPSRSTDTVVSDNRTFFVTLGKHIAQRRKDQGLTQQALAEQLGIAQQTVAHYEGARLRLPASMLPQLARIFGIGVDTLIGESSQSKSKHGLAPKLQQQIERISRLSKPKQRFVLGRLKTMLAQASR